MRERIRSLRLAGIGVIVLGWAGSGLCQETAPSPLLKKGQAVDWWFVFKFNNKTYPRAADSKPACLFGGVAGGSGRKDGPYKNSAMGQSYAYASNEEPTLQMGTGYVGDSTNDPVGATFDEIYNGNLHYVVWNDQFYGDPMLDCEKANVKEKQTNCPGPWAHSKGILAWNGDGNGVVMQVTTPDWPGSGSKDQPRAEGNSLGCTNDNNVELSQDFFALKLDKEGVLKVLAALAEEGAVTDPGTQQIVSSEQADDIQGAVAKLGHENTSATFKTYPLPSGVQLIAKGGGLDVPPWQMVSSVLGHALRVASFWTDDVIYSTNSKTRIACWSGMPNPPGAVEIAETGTWQDPKTGKTTAIGLTGKSEKSATGQSLGTNHAKIGVSTDEGTALTIFGDMNQDGALTGKDKGGCADSQNGRGGLFFVVTNQKLHDSVAGLLKGKSEPLAGSKRASSQTKKASGAGREE
jgi:Deoxyribonuclease II